jgi:hypothetical protein
MIELTRITTAWIHPRDICKLQNNLSGDISEYIFFCDDEEVPYCGTIKLGEAKVQITIENKNLLLSHYTNRIQSKIVEKKEAVQRINKKLEKLQDAEKYKIALNDEIKDLELTLEASKNIFFGE